MRGLHLLGEGGATNGWAELASQVGQADGSVQVGRFYHGPVTVTAPETVPTVESSLYGFSGLGAVLHQARQDRQAEMTAMAAQANAAALEIPQAL